MTDSPEIKALREQAQREFVRENEWVPLSVAIQAVRDTAERLRQQNHDAAARRDREEAAMRARLAEFENNVARGREAIKHLRADWTTDPPSQEEGGWWRYASQASREVVVAAFEKGRREAFREAVDALRGTGGPGWLEDDAYADWIERSFLSHPDNPEGT